MAHDLRVAARQAHDYLATLLLLTERQATPPRLLPSERADLYECVAVLADFIADLSTGEEALRWKRRRDDHREVAAALSPDHAE